MPSLGLFAARFVQMGLTAYGHTEADAVVAVKQLFSKFVHCYRASGQLEKRLDALGLSWYWKDEYPDKLPPYEDLNEWIGIAGNSEASAREAVMAA